MQPYRTPSPSPHTNRFLRALSRSINASFDQRESTRKQARQKQTQDRQNQRMRVFIAKYKSCVGDFHIIDRLKKYPELKQSEIEVAMKCLHVELADPEFNEKLRDIGFEMVLFDILKDDKLDVCHRATVAESLASLVSFCEKSALMLTNMEVEKWIIKEIVNIPHENKQTEYLVTLLELVRNLASRKRGDLEYAEMFVQQGYFKLANYKFEKCKEIKEVENNDGDGKRLIWMERVENQQDCRRMFKALVGTMTSLVRLGKLKSETIFEWIEFVISSYTTGEIIHIVEVVEFLRELFRTLAPGELDKAGRRGFVIDFAEAVMKMLTDQQFKKEPGTQQQQSYKEAFLSMLITALQRKHLDNAHDLKINQKFLQYQLRSQNKTLKQLALTLFALVLQNYNSQAAFYCFFPEFICKVAVQGLHPRNQNLLPYLDATAILSYGLVWPQPTQILLKLHLFDGLGLILKDYEKRSNQEIIRMLQIMIGYFQETEETSKKCRRMMERCNIVNPVERVSRLNGVMKIRKLAWKLLKLYDPTL